MGTVRLKCSGAENLFYEPDGLLLSVCLVPVDDEHSLHVLVFQLSYLGTGDIVVHIAIEGSADTPAPEGDTHPQFTAAVLRGTAGHRRPGVWLTSVAVPDTDVHYRYTVWGQPGTDDEVRGELVAEVSGTVPLLTATTKVSITQAPVPTDVVPAVGSTHPRPISVP
jgi:hypothetical protein